MQSFVLRQGERSSSIQQQCSCMTLVIAQLDVCQAMAVQAHGLEGRGIAHISSVRAAARNVLLLPRLEGAS